MSVKYISFKDGILTIQLDLLALAFLLAILLHLSVLLIPKTKAGQAQAQAQDVPFQMQLVPKQQKEVVADNSAPTVLTKQAPDKAKPDYVAPPPKPRRKPVKPVASAPPPATPPDQNVKEIEMGGLDAALNRQQPGTQNQRPGKLAMHLSDLKEPISDPHDAQEDAQTRSLEGDPLTRNIFGLWEAQIKQKVERIGQMNFPKDKQGNSIFGTLQFQLVLNGDGTIAQAKIVGTSGNPELDQAALNILHYSAPFGPVPKELLDENRQIKLVRYYQFINLGDHTKWSR